MEYISITVFNTGIYYYNSQNSIAPTKIASIVKKNLIVSGFFSVYFITKLPQHNVIVTVIVMVPVLPHGHDRCPPLGHAPHGPA